MILIDCYKRPLISRERINIMKDLKRYTRLIESFEYYISDYSFKVYTISAQERVYLIEDSIIEYLSIREEDYGRLVIEEIFNDYRYDLMLKKFLIQQEDSMVQYFPYNGSLGLSTPFMRSQYEKINHLLPELNIDYRFTVWPGKPIPYLIFELTGNKKVGYAACQTNAKQTMKKVIDIGNTLVFACVGAPDFDMMYSKFGQRYATSGNDYYFILDRNMKDIIMQRLASPNASSYKKKNLGIGRMGIEEQGMKFFWINAYIKNPEEYFNGKLIDDIKKGVYSDVDKYEYVLPENKWKSEQLVFELTKQIYPQCGVCYQFRPPFLNSGKGQLSYDVYISKLRIAIEYQGKQHYEPVEIFGGEESFRRQKERDEIKQQLSQEHGIKLVYISYWDDITVNLIKERVEG